MELGIVITQIKQLTFWMVLCCRNLQQQHLITFPLSKIHSFSSLSFSRPGISWNIGYKAGYILGGAPMHALLHKQRQFRVPSPPTTCFWELGGNLRAQRNPHGHGGTQSSSKSIANMTSMVSVACQYCLGNYVTNQKVLYGTKNLNKSIDSQ